MGQEQIFPRGRVTVRVVDRRGRTVRRLVRPNAIVTAGRTLVGDLLVGNPAGPLSHLAVGTDATAPAPEDTALGAEIVTIDRAPITTQPLTGSEVGLRISAQVSSATEQAVSEAGLFNSGDHDPGGVLYNRVVFPSPLPVGGDLDLIFEWDLTF